MLTSAYRSFGISIFAVAIICFLAGCKTTSEVHVRDASLKGAVQSSQLSADVDEISGRYFGFIRISPQRKVTAVLDLIDVPSTGDEAKSLRGVMRMFAGDFMSDEYSALYLPQMTWSDSNQTLTASGYDDRYQWESVSVKDGFIEGMFTFVKAGVTGAFKMRRQQSIDEGTLEVLGIFPEAVAAKSFTGNYYGECQENQVTKQMTIQVEATRWSGAYGLAGVLDGMRVAGRFGLFDKNLCGSSDKSCIYAHFRSGEINFLTGALQLRGNPIDKSCVQDGTDLVCDGCRMNAGEEMSPGDLNPPQDYQVFRRKPEASPHSQLSRNVSTAAEAEGQYFGYLHHETQDRYQLMGLNVMRSRESAGGQNSSGAEEVSSGAEEVSSGAEKISAVASLYFGDSGSQEFVAHRLEKERFASGQKLALDGPGGGFLVIEDWRENSLRGVWYSKSAGRIGTLELKRGDAPALPAGVQSFAALSGVYEGDEWQFELSVSANVSESLRDYYPLRMMGWAREKIPTARRRMIEEGSYDFYTNSLAFRLDDGRMVVGRQTQNGVELFWPPYSNVGTPMQRQGVKSYVAAKRQPATVSSSRAPDLEVNPPEARSQSF